MPGKKYEKKLHVEMTFAEALGRFARVDPKEGKPVPKKKKKPAKRFLKP
jgi:hypothetical protein